MRRWRGGTKGIERPSHIMRQRPMGSPSPALPTCDTAAPRGTPPREARPPRHLRIQPPVLLAPLPPLFFHARFRACSSLKREVSKAARARICPLFCEAGAARNRRRWIKKIKIRWANYFLSHVNYETHVGQR